jgi:hypothetical protein
MHSMYIVMHLYHSLFYYVSVFIQCVICDVVILKCVILLGGNGCVCALMKDQTNVTNHSFLFGGVRFPCNVRWITIFLVTCSVGYVTSFDGSLKYFVCCSIWLVFLHYTSWIQR